MVYSTCSVEPEENEEVVDFLIGRFPEAEIEKIDLSIKKSEPVLEFENKNYSGEVGKVPSDMAPGQQHRGFFRRQNKKIMNLFRIFFWIP